MILEARTRDALTEVLVIASALSGQDVRDRPQEAAQAADEKHKKFDDEKSEFMGYLKLWKWLGDSKGGEGEHKLSHRKHEALLRENFVSPRRVREWRDVHSQLHTVVTEHGWRLNQSPATYEQVHLSMLAGLLGNIGQKSDDEDWYLGARGIKFYRHPGAHLSKKPGRWIVAAELVDTSRLYGRGLANIEPQWLPPIAGHLIKTQLLEPHWEKKAAEVVALERATLYGIVLYSGKRVNFGRVDAKTAREIFIREGLVNDELPEDLVKQLPFIGHNRRQIAKVEALEHKSRRQDVLVDDELIYAFYDDKLPPNVFSGATLLKWWRDASKGNDKLLQLSQDELMRHEAAGVTSEAFPKVIRLGGVDCAATYLHQPGDVRDGLTVTVPIFALNQVSEERAEWLVPGMLAAKVTALLKSLHQKPRARLTPLPDFVAEFIELQPFCQGGLVDALLRAVKDRTQLAVQRNDFKLEQLAPHLFMNFRVVDEHGRQLGQGRQLAALKAELGGQARSAFQALAALKLPAKDDAPKPAPAAVPGKGIRAEVVAKKPEPAARDASQAQDAKYVDWTFGELPELLEVRKGGQTLIGFPALIDKGNHVEIEVFDEPEVAAAKHRAGLRRLIALQLKEPLRYLEKNVPDLQRMSVLYMGLGTAEELRDQIIGVALDRAFLGDPLPTDPTSFKKRIEEGRSRLNLIAQEVARAVHAVLQELANASRKLKDSRPAKDVGDDITAQLQRLVPKRFALDTPWAQLQHLPRYLKAVTARLDKLRADPARDAKLIGEVKPLEQRYTRRVAELKGVKDARLDDFRWQLEELRVSLFAQELRTPQPVSVKRLEKVWGQLAG
jgi:ATP-dependent helicase HrpA